MAVCRYCGKALPLLERFSGSGEFCSRDHRQRYQEECSRLALRRLLGEDDAAETAATQPVETARPRALAATTATGVAAIITRRETETRGTPPPRSALPPPRVAPAIPASPGLVALRRGEHPGLPIPSWTWRVDWENMLLAGCGLEELEAREAAPPVPAPPVKVPTPVTAPPPAKAVAAPVVEPERRVAPPAAPQAQPVIRKVEAPAPRVNEAPAAAAPVQQRERPRPEPRPAAPELTEAPAFESAVATSSWSRMPLFVRIAVFAATIILFGYAAQRYLGGDSATKTDARQADVARAITMGPGGWFTADMPDRTGKKRRAGTFSIYRPALELSDYRVEFTGRIEQTSLGWVVRWTDADNYQAMKLTRQTGRLKLSRWMVLAGEDTTREEIALPPLSSSTKGHTVRVDANGPRFTIQMEGQQVASWTDNRLPRGGFGFLNEGDERGRIDSVQVFLLSH